MHTASKTHDTPSFCLRIVSFRCESRVSFSSSIRQNVFIIERFSFFCSTFRILFFASFFTYTTWFRLARAARKSPPRQSERWVVRAKNLYPFVVNWMRVSQCVHVCALYTTLLEICGREWLRVRPICVYIPPGQLKLITIKWLDRRNAAQKIDATLDFSVIQFCEWQKLVGFFVAFGVDWNIYKSQDLCDFNEHSNATAVTQKTNYLL